MTQLQLPAFLQNSTRSVAAQALAGLSQGSPAQISIRQNRFRLVDSGGQEKLIETFHLDVVIADANPHISHVFYKDAYDPTAAEYKPPSCYSDNGQGPSEAALDPQSATCAACPQNAWGSATSKVTGKATKACNDVKKLACLVPEHAPGLAFMLRIPPASLKNLAAYVAGLNGQVTGGRRVDVTDVVTRITFDAKTQGVLNFQAVNWIDEEIFKFLEEKGPNPYPQLTGANDQPRQVALPAPKAGSPLAQAPYAPAVVEATAPGATAFAPNAAPAQPQEPREKGATSPLKETGFGGNTPFGGPAVQNGFAAPQAHPAFVASTQEVPKRTRRTKAEMEADAAAKAAPQAQFGIVQNAPAPDNELGAAISAAFNLPM